MSDTTLIEYVGRQTNRVDDVLHTKRVWASRGSVLDVPTKEAAFYLMYPKEWQEITAEQYASRETARAHAADNLHSVKAVWADLSVEDLESMRDEISDEITVRRHAPVVVPESMPSHPEVDGQADDADSRDAATSRLQTVMAVIKDMDPQDDEQYTSNGSPRVPAVSDRAGFKVSYDEIGEAMDLLNG